MAVLHKPVLLEESLQYLITDRNGIYIDCTLGTGGHFEALSRRLEDDATLVGFDADPAAIDFCKTHLSLPQKTQFINQNFGDIAKYMFRYGYGKVTGILMDLGLSTFALDEPSRGFSFQSEGPLDMRFSPSTKMPAATFINSASQTELSRIFWEYGEERQARRIARAIIESRQEQSIGTTKELAEIISNQVPARFRIKTLSRIFQAIRIHTNREMEVLHSALPQALDLLLPEGRLVLISYHSLEDRLVKQFFRRESRNCICPPDYPVCRCDHRARLHELTKAPVTPGPEEVRENSRARSAKMRVASKIGGKLA